MFSNKAYLNIDIIGNEKNSNIISNDNFEISNQNFSEEPILNQVKEEENIWKIEIPRINLNANIQEGTSQEVLNLDVGHFTQTSLFDGNIGLAAHNRGYNVNYFAKIKELETGDEIYYSYNGNTREYIVKTRDIIKETDWSYLEQTEDNRITLITCVEDMPEYRRCIQAVEKKEE